MDQPNPHEPSARLVGLSVVDDFPASRQHLRRGGVGGDGECGDGEWIGRGITVLPREDGVRWVRGRYQCDSDNETGCLP
jgi:hypothetical protein